MKIVLVVGFAFAASLVAMACAHAAGGDTQPALPDRIAEPGAVDLNRADESDLIALPGIGPMKAEAIIAYRKKHGSFARVEDLRKVRGFGRKSVARLRPMITIGSQKPGEGNAGAQGKAASP